MKIMSIDTSYTTTGFVVYDDKNKKIKYGRILTPKTDKESLLDYFLRINCQKEQIMKIIQKEKPSAIIIEGASFFMKGNTFLQTVVYNYFLRYFIFDYYIKKGIECEIIITPPKTFKKLFLNGVAEKKEIIEKIKETGLFDFSVFKKNDIDDVCDAIMFLLVYLNNKDDMIKKSEILKIKTNSVDKNLIGFFNKEEILKFVEKKINLKNNINKKEV